MFIQQGVGVGRHRQIGSVEFVVTIRKSLDLHDSSHSVYGENTVMKYLLSQSC